MQGMRDLFTNSKNLLKFKFARNAEFTEIPINVSEEPVVLQNLAQSKKSPLDLNIDCSIDYSLNSEKLKKSLLNNNINNSTSSYQFKPLDEPLNEQFDINYGPESRWEYTKDMCAKVWETKTGKAAVIVSGFLAGYALVAAIVRAAKDAKVTEDSHSMPFNNTYLGTYNKDIDDRLKFITAAVSIQLRKLCDTEGADMSWESLEAILAQCPVLEADQNKVYGEETFNEEFSKVDDVNTWLYDFINKHDGDVLDAARIHNNEIRNVIKFVGDQSVEFNVFSKAVSTSTNLIDIGMIRFPTKTDPCVKLYRLQLRGTFVGKKFMMIFSSEENRSITASVSSHKYYPRDELLQRIQSENVKNTLNKFESMFK